MSQISDQNILLKAQLAAASGGNTQQNQQQQNFTNTQHNGFSDQHQQYRIQELEHQVVTLMNEKSHYDTKISFYEAENARLVDEIEQFKKISVDENVIVQLKNEVAELNAKIEKNNKDQDDLLELLADQDGKMREYRKKLKLSGHTIDDFDDDDE